MYPKVEVIAHHAPNEVPRPLRVRFEENHQKIVLKIVAIKDVKHERLMGNKMIVYRVSVIQEKIERIVGLKYEIESLSWYLTP